MLVLVQRQVLSRCPRFMDVLAGEMITGHLQNKHDVTSLFLVVVLKGSSLDDIKIRNVEGTEIDINFSGKGIELKTKKNVGFDEVSRFIDIHFENMVTNQDEKHVWWLVFMLKRVDCKEYHLSGGKRNRIRMRQ
mgnify:CR=1 FL=1